MKILFVCQQYIHAARWINQLRDSEHEIYVFDCLDKPIHKDLLWTNYTTNWSKRKLPILKGEYFLEIKLPLLYQKIAPILKLTADEKLVRLIKEIKPDLVHSLEMQSETYPLIKARRQVNFNWAYFCWGSDLFLYQSNQRHQRLIRQVFDKLNYLFIDNNRDSNIAKLFGFKGISMPVFPGGGGYDLEMCQKFIKPISERNIILIKGYHHWSGRALVVLQALELIIEELKNYTIYVYSAHDIVIDKIKEINKKHSVNIGYSSRFNQISHRELLEKFGQAKIAIGNNISDGIPNTLLEAIIMGAFPIQSNPGKVTEEYIVNNENGLLIENPEDEKEIASLIKKAVISDNLIEKASKTNQHLANMLAYKKVQEKVLKAYKEIATNL